MENTRDQIDFSEGAFRQLIHGIGQAMAQTVATTETDLLAQGRDDALVRCAVATGALNAIGGYIAVRLFPQADPVHMTEHVQTCLHRAFATVLQTALPSAGEAADEWPTGRIGTA